jgi:glucose-1-phosphate adenylyltransferase
MDYSTEDDVILADCDIICNIDLKEVLEFHEERGADITSVYTKNMSRKKREADLVGYDVSADGTVDRRSKSGGMIPEENLGINIWVVKREFLQSLVGNLWQRRGKLCAGRFDGPLPALCPQGFFIRRLLRAHQIPEGYMRHNKEMLQKEKRDLLLGVRDRPIFTKVAIRRPPNMRSAPGPSIPSSPTLP